MWSPSTSSVGTRAVDRAVSEDVVKTRLTRARHAIQQNLLERTGAATAQAFMFGQSRCDDVVAAVLERIA